MSHPLPTLGIVEEKLGVTADDGVIIDVWRSFDPRRAGPGSPAVVVCHGFIQNRFAFESRKRSMLDHLRGLGLVVFTIELRGRGDVNRADGLFDYVARDAAAVVDRVARDHEKLAWVGHSMGGIIGTLLDAERAARIHALVTIGAPLFAGRPELHSRATTSAAIRAARLAHRAGHRFEGKRWSGFLYATRKVLDTPWVPAPSRIWAPGSLDEESLAFTLSESFANDSWAVFADMLELVVTDGARAGRLDAGARLAAHERPVLVVAGDADDLAPRGGARPLFLRLGSAHKEYLEVGAHHGVRAGHIDLLIGDAAPHLVWAPIASFLRRHLLRAQ